MDEVLCASRAPIRSSIPPQPPGAQHLIDSYTAPRRSDLAALPELPSAEWEPLVGAIQAARGSAPGVDGVPYE
eukprot:7884751-Alexandrium_andersonii.AAC.1